MSFTTDYGHDTVVALTSTINTVTFTSYITRWSGVAWIITDCP